MKLDVHLAHESAFPLLGIFLREIKTYVIKMVCTQMFIAA